MERARQPIKDREQYKIMEHVYKNAMNIPIEVDTAPTEADKVKSDALQINGSDIYIKTPSGKLLRLTGVEVTE